MTFRGKVFLMSIGALAVVGLLYLLDTPSNERLAIHASNNVIINIDIRK